MNTPSPSPTPAITSEVVLLANRYQLLDKLGEGGMGIVFRARDTTLDRLVAVKILPAGKLQDAEAIARFRRESLALAKMSHPHIIPAHDSGQDGEKHFLVMALVEGHSLSAELSQKGRIPPTHAADYVRQAALALQYAHRLGLIHRDVKPSNLLLSAGGHVLLLDLGLARFLQDQIGEDELTRSGIGMGTPDYCSPEQFRDAHKADARSDIYSLGCTLYHLIAGKPPFPGSSMSEKARAHESQDPPPIAEVCPDIPGGLILALSRMLAKRPADRFADMAEVAEALAPYVAGSSESLLEIRTTVSWNGGQLKLRNRSRRWRRALPWITAATILLTLGSLAGLNFFWMRDRGTSFVEAGNDETKNPSPPVALDDTNALTVSKDAKDGGQFRSLAEAVASVRHPNAIVRVLDDAQYADPLVIRDPATQAGLTVEAPRRASLVPDSPSGAVVSIERVPRVTIRGLRIHPEKALAGIEIAGACPGVILEDLEIVSGTVNETSAVGITMKHLELKPEDAPAIVQDCTILRCKDGIQVAGVETGTDRASPSNRVVLVRNHLDKVERGIVLAGRLNEIHVLANRLSGCKRGGICLSNLLEGSSSILVANNSIGSPHDCIQIQGPIALARNVAIRNNYLLAEVAPDISVDEASRKAVASWQVDSNARPIYSNRADSGSALLPPTRDLTGKELDSPKEALKSGDFLPPKTKSALAQSGAGVEDPTLPTYIGAVPPQGAMPWDWDRARRMPRSARLLTVSQQESEGGKYRTINDALKEARPWDTVRVLDDAEYEECLSLNDKAKFEGVTIDAPKRAKLVMRRGDLYAIDLTDVPHLALRGFRFEDLAKSVNPGRAFVNVSGNVAGTVLADLDINTQTYPVGIVLKQIDAAVEPLVVTRCSVQTYNDGITISGNPSIGQCRGIRLSENRVRATGDGTRGILLRGWLEDVQVAGNLVLGCSTVGMQIEEPSPSLRRVLLANNTMGNCKIMGFRLFEYSMAKQHAEGQVKIANNLFFGSSYDDAAYFIAEKDGQLPGNMENLLATWSFRGNARDMSGTEASLQIPMSKWDRMLGKADLLSTKGENPERIRPAQSSPLAVFGVGGGVGLPAYVGAMPPEGVALWDWDRTWRTRTSAKVERISH